VSRHEAAMRLFHDRRDAGQRLAAALEHLRGSEPIILGLPRGGVPVAAEVARALGAPLDVIVVRKLGVPFQPELGMGAIGEGGARVLNEQVLHLAGVTPDQLSRVETRERAEIERRARLFRDDRPPLPLTGRTAVIVDDGIATGGTAHAALQVARAHGAARIVLAVPVAPAETLRELAPDADEIVCLATPTDFFAVGQWYRDFSQTADSEVRSLLEEAAATTRPGAVGSANPPVDPPGVACDEEVALSAGPVELSGRLTIPVNAAGVVVFAHGSGSSRHSPRNRFVARTLNDAGLATLLFDLLTPAEELNRANVFDVALLGERLTAATEWLAHRSDAAALPVGYFGASTGAAAALWAAAQLDAPVRAIVSRGGRADLAGGRLRDVHAATLLIVGGRDTEVLRLNREAAGQLRCEHRIEVIPGATHLFEEPGTLETVAHLAQVWFRAHLPGSSAPTVESPS
jgi:putative phosphoribosyl transferase